MSVKVNRKARSRRRKKSGRLHSWLLLFGVLLVIGFGVWKVWSSDTVQMRFVYMWDYQQDIVTYSKKNNVDPFLVAAIIKNESNFKHDAVSKVGAVGLMQIMPETGRWTSELQLVFQMINFTEKHIRTVICTRREKISAWAAGT